MPASFAVDSEASLYFLCVRERERIEDLRIVAIVLLLLLL